MKQFLRSRNLLLLGLLLVGMPLPSQADEVKHQIAADESIKCQVEALMKIKENERPVNFPEIEALLKSKGDLVKVPTEVDANKVLFREIVKQEGGLCAYSRYTIRDAYELPNDWGGIGKVDEVVWVGQLSSGFQSLAIYFINATTGKVFTLKRPSKTKKAEQEAAEQSATVE